MVWTLLAADTSYEVKNQPYALCPLSVDLLDTCALKVVLSALPLGVVVPCMVALLTSFVNDPQI